MRVVFKIQLGMLRWGGFNFFANISKTEDSSKKTYQKVQVENLIDFHLRPKPISYLLWFRSKVKKSELLRVFNN